MNMETFRVTKEVALTKTPLAKLDLGEATLVKVDRAIPRAHDTKWVRYRVRLPDGDPLAAFPAGLSQEVKRIDEHTAEITVRAVRPSNESGTLRVPAGGTRSVPDTLPDVPTEADRGRIISFRAMIP